MLNVTCGASRGRRLVAQVFHMITAAGRLISCTLTWPSPHSTLPFHLCRQSLTQVGQSSGGSDFNDCTFYPSTGIGYMFFKTEAAASAAAAALRGGDLPWSQSKAPFSCCLLPNRVSEPGQLPNAGWRSALGPESDLLEAAIAGSVIRALEPRPGAYLERRSRHSEAGWRIGVGRHGRVAELHLPAAVCTRATSRCTLCPCSYSPALHALRIHCPHTR